MYIIYPRILCFYTVSWTYPAIRPAMILVLFCKPWLKLFCTHLFRHRLSLLGIFNISVQTSQSCRSNRTESFQVLQYTLAISDAQLAKLVFWPSTEATLSLQCASPNVSERRNISFLTRAKIMMDGNRGRILTDIYVLEPKIIAVACLGDMIIAT